WYSMGWLHSRRVSFAKLLSPCGMIILCCNFEGRPQSLTPFNPIHNNLGYAYMLARRHDEARREFTTALQLDPSFYKARYNLNRLDDEASLN
ncbi:MAG: Tetratricopeptide repeat-containing protein, partial [Candidatus Nitrotoga sp. MKT]